MPAIDGRQLVSGRHPTFGSVAIQIQRRDHDAAVARDPQPQHVVRGLLVLHVAHQSPDSAGQPLPRQPLLFLLNGLLRHGCQLTLLHELVPQGGLSDPRRVWWLRATLIVRGHTETQLVVISRVRRARHILGVGERQQSERRQALRRHRAHPHLAVCPYQMVVVDQRGPPRVVSHVGDEGAVALQHELRYAAVGPDDVVADDGLNHGRLAAWRVQPESAEGLQHGR
mmetsp:Transcript_61988/g.157654  ORF Transcript_61988/g.157654 Transcript_61988/m.157654 type:complete len:226 (+) Transcript_61988:254-931(+)